MTFTDEQARERARAWERSATMWHDRAKIAEARVAALEAERDAARAERDAEHAKAERLSVYETEAELADEITRLGAERDETVEALRRLLNWTKYVWPHSSVATVNAEVIVARAQSPGGPRGLDPAAAQESESLSGARAEGYRAGLEAAAGYLQHIAITAIRHIPAAEVDRG